MTSKNANSDNLPIFTESQLKRIASTRLLQLRLKLKLTRVEFAHAIFGSGTVGKEQHVYRCEHAYIIPPLFTLYGASRLSGQSIELFVGHDSDRIKLHAVIEKLDRSELASALAHFDDQGTV